MTAEQLRLIKGKSGLKIIDVKTVLLTGPLTSDPSLLVFRKLRSAAFIEIHTDSGITGIGETYIGYFAPEVVPSIVEFFRPVLVGLTEDEIQPGKIHERMVRCAHFWARTGLAVSVLAGIEAAMWDLRGKLDNKPVHELLGGAKYDRLLCYATGSVSNYPWPMLSAKIERYRVAGFRAAKFAAGWYDASDQTVFTATSPQEWADIESEKLEAIGRATGGDFAICMDAHMDNMHHADLQPWTIDIAKAVMQAVEPYDLLFFEEPFNYDHVKDYAELCRNTSVDIAGGECLTTPKEFQAYADLDALDIAQPDASFIGIGPFVQVATMFAERGRKIATHAWSSGAGIMANIHAAFASPGMAIVEIPPLAGPLHTEVWAPGLRFQDGYILPPDAPGLGVTLTEEIKNRFPFVPGSGEFNPVPGKPQVM